MKTQPSAAGSASKAKSRSLLFTIGYEGKTQEELLALLRSHGVEQLLDVRYNAISRKPGFSKKRLAEGCKDKGIQYAHVRELGVEPSLRPDLRIPSSVQNFLVHYQVELLPQASEYLKTACSLVIERPTALLCFERDVSCCHRGPLSAKIAQSTNLTVKHL